VAASDAWDSRTARKRARPVLSLTALIRVQSIRLVPSVPPCAEGKERQVRNGVATTVGWEGQPPPWRTLGTEARSVVRQLEERMAGTLGDPAKVVPGGMDTGGNSFTPDLSIRVHCRITRISLVARMEVGGATEEGGNMEAVITEPAVVPETYVNGVLVDANEHVIRLTYYSEQYSWALGAPERIVVAKIIVPKNALAAMAEVVKAMDPALWDVMECPAA
jgi:hypothetical protein